MQTIIIFVAALGLAQTPANKNKAEKELAAIERVIEIREVELKTLKNRADALRKSLGLNRPPVKKEEPENRKIVTIQDVMNTLPENARPKSADDMIQIERANKALIRVDALKNADLAITVGIQSVRVEAIKTTNPSTQRFNVHFSLTDPAFKKSDYIEEFWSSAYIVRSGYVRYGNSVIAFDSVDDATAERLQALLKKKVTIVGQARLEFQRDASLLIFMKPKHADLTISKTGR